MINTARKLAPIIMFVLAFSCGCQAESYYTTISISNKDIDVEVVYTDEDRMKGLMGRESLESGHGMLFIFDSEEYRSFWMKNMKFAIDIIFIDRHGFIVDIKNDCQPCSDDDCPSYNSSRRAMYVLEVKSGFAMENNIKDGDRVQIN